jgi:hypothetical protein
MPEARFLGHSIPQSDEIIAADSCFQVRLKVG